jgi:heme/copper-type cytochrome/quinol oxidase subunit 3
MPDMKAILAEYFATRSRRIALLVIAANTAAFSALLILMFYLRAEARAWPSPFHFASVLMVVGLAMFGLGASVVIEAAARGKFSEPEMPTRLLAIAISLWLIFLFLEVVEWVRLVYMEGLGPHTAFGGSFLALTVTHWVAVCACVCWLTWSALNSRRRDVFAVALFSHFLNLVWIVLLFTVYFPNADLSGIA